MERRSHRGRDSRDGWRLNAPQAGCAAAVGRKAPPSRFVRVRGAGAVLHTHSLWSTLLSDCHAAAGGLAIEGYEMLKGLEGVATHEHREWIPILENDQDMVRLAGGVRTRSTAIRRAMRSSFAATGCALGERRCLRPCATWRLPKSLAEASGRTGGLP